MRKTHFTPGADTWSKIHLQSNDQIALEATTNVWEFHDQLRDQVAVVAVANSHKIKLISARVRKTDKQIARV